MSDADFDRMQEAADFASDRISIQVRYIAFGILALASALLLADGARATNLATQHSFALGAAASLAAITLLADYVQYFAKYRNSLFAMRAWLTRGASARVTVPGPNSITPAPAANTSRSFWSAVQVGSFYAKQGAVVGAIVALVLLTPAILDRRNAPPNPVVAGLNGIRDSVTAQTAADTAQHDHTIEAITGLAERTRAPRERPCVQVSTTWSSDGRRTSRCAVR